MNLPRREAHRFNRERGSDEDRSISFELGNYVRVNVRSSSRTRQVYETKAKEAEVKETKPRVTATSLPVRPSGRDGTP